MPNDAPPSPVLPPVAVANIGSTPSATQAQMQAAKDYFTSLGIGDKFTLTPEGQLPTPTGQTVPAADPVGTPELPGARVSDQQMTDAINFMRQHGVSDDRIKEMLAKEGMEATEVSDEQLASMRYNQDFGIEARPASAYHINYPAAGVRGTELGTIAEFNANATSFLAAVNMPPEMGEGLIESMVATTAAVNRMIPDQEALWRQEQRVEMRRHFGEEYPAVVERVDMLLAQVGKDHPIVKSLINGPAGGSVHTIRTLNTWAKNIQRWNSGKAK